MATRTIPPIFSRIVVGVDGTEAGFDACRQVAHLADPDAEIHAVTVVHGVAAVEDVLHRAVEILGERAHASCLQGPVTDALLDEARRFGATLVALGTHEHRRATEIVLGGVAGEILHEAPCSVLIARRCSLEAFPRQIVVGHDGSAQALSALAVADALEQRFGATVRVVSSLAGKLVDEGMVRQRSGVEVAVEPPVVALVDASRDADLLILGSRGLHGLQALGSVSERVAHDASCTVLTVRHAPMP